MVSLLYCSFTERWTAMVSAIGYYSRRAKTYEDRIAFFFFMSRFVECRPEGASIYQPGASFGGWSEEQESFALKGQNITPKPVRRITTFPGDQLNRFTHSPCPFFATQLTIQFDSLLEERPAEVIRIKPYKESEYAAQDAHARDDQQDVIDP
jgi:hypothetical protein